MDAAKLLEQLISAGQSGQWVVAAGAGLMILVAVGRWIIGTFSGKAIPRAWLPWLTALIGTLAAVATSLTTAKSGPWWKAAIVGLVVGATASGLWSLVGKHIYAWLTQRGLVTTTTVKTTTTVTTETENTAPPAEPKPTPTVDKPD